MSHLLRFSVTVSGKTKIIEAHSELAAMKKTFKLYGNDFTDFKRVYKTRWTTTKTPPTTPTAP